MHLPTTEPTSSSWQNTLCSHRTQINSILTEGSVWTSGSHCNAAGSASTSTVLPCFSRFSASWTLQLPIHLVATRLLWLCCQVRLWTFKVLQRPCFHQNSVSWALRWTFCAQSWGSLGQGRTSWLCSHTFMPCALSTPQGGYKATALPFHADSLFSILVWRFHLSTALRGLGGKVHIDLQFCTYARIKVVWKEYKGESWDKFLSLWEKCLQINKGGNYNAQYQR